MTRTSIVLLSASLTVAGCGLKGGTDIAEPRVCSESAVTSVSPTSSESQKSESLPTDRVQKLAFSTPKGWPTRPPKIGTGIVMFAPENEAWNRLGFRPNLSVKISHNPGMDLDKLKAILDEQLTKSIHDLNASLLTDAKAVLDAEERTLTIEDLKFELQKSLLKDGYPCLTSECFGAFNLDGRIIKTKTCSIALIDSSNIYTTTIIFPLSHEHEFKQEWEAFRETLRFEK